MAEDRDHELIQRAQAGDFDAFESLVVGYQRRVYGLARRIVGQEADADEVVQLTFLSVIEHLREFRGEAKFSTWLLRIATNHALVLLRKRARHRTVPLGEEDRSANHGDTPRPEFIAQWQETPESIASRHETHEILDEALGHLDEKYRVVFVLRDIEGFSVNETAQMLDISVSNVKVRLLRARLMLRERLTKQFGDQATQLFMGHDHA